EGPMEFEPADYEWDDVQTGLITRARHARLSLVLDEINVRMLAALQKHHSGLTLQAAVLPNILATGTRGDRRIYSPIVMLYANRFPGYKRLGRIARAITNTTPVSHVIYCTTHLLPTDVIEANRLAGADITVAEDGKSFSITGVNPLVYRASAV